MLIGTVVNAESDTVLHLPVTSAVENIELIITASSSSGIDMIVRGVVFFRQSGDMEYLSQPMLRSEKNYEAKIPSRYITGKALEYYIALYTSDGNVITSPAQNTVSLPYVIAVMPATQGWFEIFYPEAGSVIEERKPEISVGFIADSVATTDDIQIRLDGRDVTDKCEITELYFSYIPSKDLDPGMHSITLINLSKAGMAGSWQFVIKGKKTMFQDFSGTASLTWQYADSNSESRFLLYNDGSSFSILGQLNGQILSKQFDSWINKNTLYGSDTMDFGLGFYGDNVTVNAGDIFPSMSELTLGGMPAMGIELSAKPSDRFSLRTVFAESRLYDDDKDKFLSDLLNSEFGGLQISISPIKDKWQITSSYIYARNDINMDPDLLLSMEKENGIMSFGTKISLPAQFILNSEWARSDNKTDYGEELGADVSIDQAFSASVTKQLKPLSLEAFYTDVGDSFISEVNPFLEIGRKGLGISAQYSHIKGLSTQAEYARYYQKSSSDTQMRANLLIFPSKFLSISLGYLQQRLPYAKYDIRGANIGSSYKLWKLNLYINGSWSKSHQWTNNMDRNSFYLSVRAKYDITSITSFNTDYSQFWLYCLKALSSLQRQFSTEINHYVKKKHILGIGLKSVRFNDKENSENSYIENVLLIKYQYLF